MRAGRSRHLLPKIGGFPDQWNFSVTIKVEGSIQLGREPLISWMNPDIVYHDSVRRARNLEEYLGT